MIEKEYCIIGGGVAGIGFLAGLVESGRDDVLLIEGRDQLMYTLTWLGYVEKQYGEKGVTGRDFRKIVSGRMDVRPFLSAESRVIHVDPKEREVVFVSGDDLERCRYGKLIVAAGGVPIIYGDYLLPGFRGAGIFSAYQVGEMLEHFDFMPGKRLVVYGEDEYVADLTAFARDCGIEAVALLPDHIELRGMDIPVVEGRIERLEGGLRLEKVILDNGEEIQCDSLAVAGKFVPERWWREHGILYWDLKKWEGRSLYDDIVLVGDIKKPTFDFVEQYQESYEAGRQG